MAISANINEAYAGYATVNKSGHGLIDGDYVYITSNVESYNGFWYVNIEDGNKFKIRQYATADDQAYVVDANIEYCEVDSTHGVSCVHLPITYKLRSDLFPTNEVDTATTVTSFNNDSGYVNVNLAGSTISAAPFEYLKIGDEVYQVIEYVSDISYTIALAYDSTLDLVGQSVNKYYNNYNIVVRVYGGLDPAHAWATKKPYELLGTLNLVPDSNNEVFFSISELLKSQIRINNNLLIDTFPNNIDGFTQFYISYAESYDDSLGTNYALGTYTSSFTEDSFEGMAVNAKLPFKGIHSGNLTDYVMNRTTAKFLTLFTVPVLFSGCYQDASFIIDSYTGAIGFINDSFDSGSWQEWEQTTVGSATWNAISPGTVQAASASSGTKMLAGVRDGIRSDKGFPPGNYSVRVRAVNNSTGGSSPFTSALSIQGTNSLTTDSGTVITYTGTGTWDVGAGYITRDLSFTTDQYWDYLGFGFFKQGPSGGYNVDIEVSEITMLSSPQYDVLTLKVNEQYYLNGNLGIDQDVLITDYNTGVYRHELTSNCYYDRLDITLKDADEIISETKTILIDCDCENQSICLSWLNYLGGMDYWNFTSEKEYQVSIEEASKTKTNIFPQWPKSYGEFADTIEKQTFRKSRTQVQVRSQYVTEAQIEAIKYIKTSPLVQIVNSRQDRRTVIVDEDSFTVRQDRQKLFDISFTITYTDEIPSQMV